ncbi:hypothetical protein Tco_0146486 [Tanacetum coccineum]
MLLCSFDLSSLRLRSRPVRTDSVSECVLSWRCQASKNECAPHITNNFVSFVDETGATKTVLGEIQRPSACPVLPTIQAGRNACSFMLCDLDFEPLSLFLSSMPSCDLVSLTNILILCLILKASDQSLRKSLSLNLELS